MRRKSVFKVTAYGEIFKVTTIEGIGDEMLWAVMKGREYAKRPFLYRTPDEAIDRAVYLAKLELHENNILLYKP